MSHLYYSERILHRLNKYFARQCYSCSRDNFVNQQIFHQSRFICVELRYRAQDTIVVFAIIIVKIITKCFSLQW